MCVMQENMHTISTTVRVMSTNMDRLGTVVATIADRQRRSKNSAGVRPNQAGPSARGAVRRSSNDDGMNADDGELADVDVDRPLPVPKKPRTGPKLKGLPVKRDPKRKALLV